MLNWTRQPKEDSVISGRGPGSGTGQPLPDEDAIAILDERVEEPAGKTSGNADLGVVIDPDTQTTAPLAWREGKFLVGPSAPPMFDPSPYTDLERCYSEAKKWFEPEIPKCIVVIDNIETPVHSILECCPPTRFRTWDALSVKLLLGEALVNVNFAPERISPEATLLDLLKKREH
jgi:hypothetical protein